MLAEHNHVGCNYEVLLFDRLHDDSDDSDIDRDISLQDLLTFVAADILDRGYHSGFMHFLDVTLSIHFNEKVRVDRARLRKSHSPSERRPRRDIEIDFSTEAKRGQE